MGNTLERLKELFDSMDIENQKYALTILQERVKPTNGSVVLVTQQTVTGAATALATAAEQSRTRLRRFGNPSLSIAHYPMGTHYLSAKQLTSPIHRLTLKTMEDASKPNKSGHPLYKKDPAKVFNNKKKRVW